VISIKLNMVVFEDGYKEDYPDTKALPQIGETVKKPQALMNDLTADGMLNRDAPFLCGRVASPDRLIATISNPRCAVNCIARRPTHPGWHASRPSS
jgi:hypothetical protein